MHRVLFSFAVFFVMLSALPARAATTVFADSVVSQSGPIVNANGALGTADGLGAILTRPAALVLALGGPTLDPAFTVNATLLGNGSQARVSLGVIANGVAVFTATQSFARGTGPGIFDFSTECAALASEGCTLVRFQVAGSPSSVFTLDGVSAVSAAPEPSQWALMVIAFVLIAARMKIRRTGISGVIATIGYSPAAA